MVGIPSWVGLQARGDIGESGNLLEWAGGWGNCRGEAEAYSERSEPSGGERQRTPPPRLDRAERMLQKKLKRGNVNPPLMNNIYVKQSNFKF